MTQTATKKRSPTKKAIYDWAQLVDALSNPPAPPKGEVAEYVHAMATKHLHRKQSGVGSYQWVQLDDRLLAESTPTHIRLHWAHTPKSRPMSETRIESCVEVYPAAGGRTTYCIDDSVNGWFANRYLPLSAGQRRSRSIYRSAHWFYGQAGVYQQGQGPYYIDAGADISNWDLARFEKEVSEMPGAPEQWRGIASAFASKITAAVAPFKDTVVRYEAYCDCEDCDLPSLDVRAIGKFGGVIARSPYGAFIRLKNPLRQVDGGFQIVPDFAAFITGPHMAYEKSRDYYFGAQLLHPQGRFARTEWGTGAKGYETGLPSLFMSGFGEVVEAARQWAANLISIPCA